MRHVHGNEGAERNKGVLHVRPVGRSDCIGGKRIRCGPRGRVREGDDREALLRLYQLQSRFQRRAHWKVRTQEFQGGSKILMTTSFTRWRSNNPNSLINFTTPITAPIRRPKIQHTIKCCRFELNGSLKRMRAIQSKNKAKSKWKYDFYFS